MKLNSLHLEAFQAVAKSLNFTTAAEKINVTQSALSQRILGLEEELQITLFIRDRKNIRLTEAGQKLIRFCQLYESAESDLLSQLKDSKQEFKGVLRVAGMSSVMSSILVPGCADLMRSNPQLSIEFMNREIRDLPQALRSTEADYVISSEKPESSDFESVFLGTETNVLVRSQSCKDYNIFLDHDESDETTIKYFTKNKMKFEPTCRRYLDDIHGVLAGVKSGYGSAILPQHLIKGHKDLQIVDSKKILQVSVFLIFFKQPYYRKIHTKFLEEVTKSFSNVLK